MKDKTLWGKERQEGERKPNKYRKNQRKYKMVEGKTRLGKERQDGGRKGKMGEGKTRWMKERQDGEGKRQDGEPGKTGWQTT